MDKILYDIYFRGGIAPGESLDTVKANLAKLFKASDEKITAMFSGRAIVLKKDLEEDAAQKYQSIMEKAGAKVILRQQPTATPSEKKVTSSSTQSAQPIQPTQQQTPSINEAPGPAKTESWDLAPVGSDVLNDSEKKPFKKADIDTSTIKLASVFDQVTETAAPPPPPPNTDHISVANIGADILAEKPKKPSAPDIDLSGMDVEPL